MGFRVSGSLFVQLKLSLVTGVTGASLTPQSSTCASWQVAFTHLDFLAINFCPSQYFSALSGWQSASLEHLFVHLGSLKQTGSSQSVKQLQSLSIPSVHENSVVPRLLHNPIDLSVPDTTLNNPPSWLVNPI